MTDKFRSQGVLRGQTQTIQRFFSHRDDDYYGEHCSNQGSTTFSCLDCYFVVLVVLVLSSNKNKLCQPLFDLQIVLLLLFVDIRSAVIIISSLWNYYRYRRFRVNLLMSIRNRPPPPPPHTIREILTYRSINLPYRNNTIWRICLY